MNLDREVFLGLRSLPARLTVKEVGWVLGFEPHELSILICIGLLKPLGHSTRNAIKFFAAHAIEQLRQNERWLSNASDAILSHWRARNERHRKSVSSRARRLRASSQPMLAEPAEARAKAETE